jgi:hypothetical protein
MFLELPKVAFCFGLRKCVLMEKISKKNKTILFISPDFYQYTRQIIAELQKEGYKVVFWSARPSLNQFDKWRMQRSESCRRRMMDAYTKRILACSPSEIDLLVFNDPVYFDRKEIQTIISGYMAVPKVINLWDTISYYPTMSSFLDLFDYKSSFDKTDCQKFNLQYQPDFIDATCLSSCGKSFDESPADVVFVGTAYPDRFVFFSKFKRYLNDQGISSKFLLYFRSRATYFYQKVHNKGYRHSSARDFVFQPISSERKNAIIRSAKAVVDIHYLDSQNGLSTREIETLFMGKKLITTSEKIADFDLFNCNNVKIIKGYDFSSVTSAFLLSPNAIYSPSVWKQYSLGTFIDNVFLRRLR